MREWAALNVLGLTLLWPWDRNNYLIEKVTNYWKSYKCMYIYMKRKKRE